MNFKTSILLPLFFISTIIQAQYTITIDDVEFDSGEIINYINTTEKNIIIPNNFSGVTITSIGEHAFEAKQLTDVLIPNTVTNIGDYAFFTNNLTNISIPNSISIIKIDAFQGNLLTNITIPNSVTEISFGAFAYNKLTSITMSYGITRIGDYAFWGNEIAEVTLPKSVVFIGEDIFGSGVVSLPFGTPSPGLTSFTLPIAEKEGFDFIEWKDGNGNSFSGNTTISIEYGQPSYTALFTEHSLSIINTSTIDDIKIYPNPASISKILTLETSENCTAIIYNTDGSIVLEKIILTKGVNKLNSNLNKGNYFIKMTNKEGKSATNQFIIK